MNEPVSPDRSPFKSLKGWHRVLPALFNSLTGLREAYRHEAAFRQELLLAMLLIPLALVLPLAKVDKILLVCSVLAVLIVELLNSAIEAVVDRISLDVHHLSKRAKDLGSAAVLLSLCQLVFVWALLTLPLLSR